MSVIEKDGEKLKIIGNNRTLKPNNSNSFSIFDAMEISAKIPTSYEALLPLYLDALQKIDFQGKQLLELKLKADTLGVELASLNRMIYGRHSEKIGEHTDPQQLTLGFNQEQQVPEPQPPVHVEYDKQKHPDHRSPIAGARQLLPEHLVRKEIRIDPKDLPQGAEKIGEEITETLDYKPGSLFVKRIIRSKYKIVSSDSATA